METKRWLITGGGRGIGRAVAEAVASAGHTVGLNYLNSESAALEMAERYPRLVHPLAADVQETGAIQTLVEQFRNLAGGVDVLVNNAGVLILHFPGFS